MNEDTENRGEDTKPEVALEQQRYAAFLFVAGRSAFVLMLCTYFLYVTGIVEPHIPLEDLPSYWGLPVAEYIQQTGAPTGWGWTRLLNKGDFLNFLGIAFLGSITILGFATLIPAYVRKKDWCFVAIVVLQIIVLCVAASGILCMG